MSSGFEVLSDIVGGVSAVLLLIPAFGSNRIARTVTQARDALQKLAAGSDQPHPKDERRAKEAIERAELLKQRWSSKDELILRIAVVLLLASFVLKGIHHYYSGIEQSSAKTTEQRDS